MPPTEIKPDSSTDYPTLAKSMILIVEIIFVLLVILFEVLYVGCWIRLTGSSSQFFRMQTLLTFAFAITAIARYACIFFRLVVGRQIARKMEQGAWNLNNPEDLGKIYYFLTLDNA